MTSSKTIKAAEKRLTESINNSQDRDTLYWAAYLDGARAQLREANDGQA